VKLADLRVENEGQVVYANLSGDIDMSNAADLRTELSLVTPNEAHSMILDLTDVNYVDSAGIHLIHHLREDLRASGQRLHLVIPAIPLVNTTLRLAGLNWTEDTAETADAARRESEVGPWRYLELREEFDPDGTLRLALVGELDLASVEALEARLTELRRGGYDVRLDLAQLEFMDSSGLAQLVAAITESRANGWRLEIGTEVTPAVARLVEITGTGAFFWPGEDS
jgi:anti-anti-sigma factor